MTLIFGDNLYYNLIIIIALSIMFTWFITQTFKVFLKCWIGRTFSFKMFFADGDFPSTHTAVVTSAVILVLYLNYVVLHSTDSNMIAAVNSAKDFLIMFTLASIVIRDAMGQRHRQDNTNNNLKNLKDYVKEIGVEKNVVDHIDATFETIFQSIDKEAGKRVGHLKHEVYGGLVIGALASMYPIIFFFNERTWLPPIAIVTLLYFIGIILFLKIKPKFSNRIRYRISKNNDKVVAIDSIKKGRRKKK